MKLQQALDYCVLVDNTELGTAWLAAELDTLFSNNSTFYCLSPMKNLGIAAAQNLALEHIYQNFSDRDYVVFFDQDSQVPLSLPRQLAQAFDRLNHFEPVAAVGPNLLDTQKSFIYPQMKWSVCGMFRRFAPDLQQTEQKVAALISSGMLSKVARLKQVGEFDAGLFIDYVDIDWSLKAQSLGLSLYVIPKLSMIHSIGIKSTRVLGRNLSLHSPQRRYYMLRNSIIMLKKHYVTRRLGLSFIYRTLIHHLIIITLEPGRAKQLHALIKGLKDGIKYKS